MTTCPRCGSFYDSRYPALSRTDNTTHICSSCGTNEAMQDAFGGGCSPQTDWAVSPAPLGWRAVTDREWTYLDGRGNTATVRCAPSGRFAFSAGDHVEGGHPTLAAAMIAAEDALN